LRDPNPGVVIEVIDVIMSSELGAQAQPLLLETLKHDDAAVRRRAIDALEGAYDLTVRESLLPYLKDPESDVRRAVIGRFVMAEDHSVAPYIANIIRSGEIYGFDEDEQREFFVALAKLGGSKFFEVFAEKLAIDEGGTIDRLLKRTPSALTDNPTRRGAISALAKLGTSESLALVKKVLARADLALAAHCDVMMRLAQRGGIETVAPQFASEERAGVAIEDVEIGRDRMGTALLFRPEELGLPADDPTTAPPPDVPVEVQIQTPWTTPPAVDGPDLGDRPLLSHVEVFQAFDQMRLSTAPESLQSPRFRIMGIEANLVGIMVSEQRLSDGPASVAEVAGRIIEKKAIGRMHEDWRYQASESVDDMLQRYLGGEAPAGPTVLGALADSDQTPKPDVEENLEEILSNYLEDGETPTGAVSQTKSDEAEEPTDGSEASVENLLKGYVDEGSPDTVDDEAQSAQVSTEEAPDAGAAAEDEGGDEPSELSGDASGDESGGEHTSTEDEAAKDDAEGEEPMDDLLRTYLEEE
jgi:hypothetical protein